ncbi:MAG TPA: peptidylprolyl isomerase [Bacteroidia bacterium]|jgi:peptidyl-prolyl cis-trans isomerase SurA
MIKKTKLILFVTLFFAFAGRTQNQNVVLDRVIAVVGNSVILESELETQCLQLKMNGEKITRQIKCKVLEQMLFRKLLLAQAIHDSITVTEEQVDQELEKRFRYYIYQFGSVEKFEAFYGKTVDQYKEDFRDDIRDILITQKMQQKITGDITVSPNDVKLYFEGLNPDSVPFINAEIEIGEIVRKPKENPELRKYARDKIEDIRKQALSGANFELLIRTYSEDKGSNGFQGGPLEYDNIPRGQFVAEFDQYAFSMKPGEITPVFETVFGFHIMKLLARKGEVVDLQHILIKIPTDPQGMQKAKDFLDSLADAIRQRKDSITFSQAASRFSDEEDSKVNGGKIVNPNTGDTRFQLSEIGQVDPNIALTIEKLKLGEMSEPVLTETQDGKEAYRILYIYSRTEPHKENMKQDYLRVQNDALNDKENKIIKKWIAKKLLSTYVRIADDYKDCAFDNDWIKPVK